MKLCSEFSKVIIGKGDFGYRHFRIPGIIAAGDSILLAFEARKGDAGDWGDIDVMVFRMDNEQNLLQTLKIGLSDTPPDGSMRTFANPVLIPDEEDRVHLIYHVNYERAFIVTSEDGGRTWGACREITDVFRQFPYQWNVCASGPGHGLRMSSGRLVVPVWLANGKVAEDGMRREHQPSVSGCIFSDDHGIHWSAGVFADQMNNGNETCAAETTDGKLLMNCRNMNEERRRVLILSADERNIERFWSADQLEDPMCFGGMVSTENGILFGNCNSTEKRVNAAVKYSADNGQNWEKIWDVDPVAGYVDVLWHDQRIYCFYERNNDKERIVDALVLSVSEKAGL